MRYRTWIDPETNRVVKHGLAPEAADHVGPNRLLGMYRAVVLKTYATDAPRTGTPNKHEIACDVLLLRSLVHYARVPVRQPEHGVNDCALWIPRPSTAVVGGSTDPLATTSLARVSRRGSPVFPFPVDLGRFDGDHVTVEFVEGDVEKPIITGSLSHPSTKRLVVDGVGWSEADLGATRGVPHLREKYFRFHGVELRINEDGDVLLDTVGATTDSEFEVPDPLRGGHVRVRLKPGKRFTVQIDGVPPGSGDAIEVYRDPVTQLVQVDLVEAATQAYMRGTSYAAAESTFLAACALLADLVAHAADAAVLASVGPLAPYQPVWVAIADAFAAWGGMTPVPPPVGGTVPVPPATAPVGVFSAALVPFTPATPQGVLSTQIRGE